MSLDTFHTRASLTVDGEAFDYFSLPALERAGFPAVARLPFSLKILLENLLRREDSAFVRADDIRALAGWQPGSDQTEISFMPARVLLQDFTGVPCVVDLAAMRDGIAHSAAIPRSVNPLQPVELVIDHSVQVDHFGRPDALQLNADLEYQRNRERYVFLRWGQTAFRNFRVVPPETGIVHQVNIEYLARVVCHDVAGAPPVGVPGYRLRHRLAHDDGERARRRRLGRRRNRGGGRDARTAELDADSAGRRLPALGPAA